jgi:hypothetical protein
VRGGACGGGGPGRWNGVVEGRPCLGWREAPGGLGVLAAGAAAALPYCAAARPQPPAPLHPPPPVTAPRKFDKHWFFHFDVHQCPPWKLDDPKPKHGVFPPPPHPDDLTSKVARPRRGAGRRGRGAPRQRRQRVGKAGAPRHAAGETPAPLHPPPHPTPPHPTPTPPPNQDYLEEFRDLISVQTMALINAAICDYHLRHCPPSEQLSDVCGKVGVRRAGPRPRDAPATGRRPGLAPASSAAAVATPAAPSPHLPALPLRPAPNSYPAPP